MHIKRADETITQHILDNYGAQSLSEGTRGALAPDNKERMMEIMQPLLERGGYYLVAFDDKEQILGWSQLGPNRDNCTQQEYGLIYELDVLPAPRGPGIANHLMTATADTLREAGHDSVRLNVFASNPARNLYESLGYEYRNMVMELPLNSN